MSSNAPPPLTPMLRAGLGLVIPSTQRTESARSPHASAKGRAASEAGKPIVVFGAPSSGNPLMGSAKYKRAFLHYACIGAIIYGAWMLLMPVMAPGRLIPLRGG
jgi:hypothetical protein